MNSIELQLVTIKPLHHRDQDCYGIYFKKDWDLIKVVKTIAGAMFSATHSCWYVPTSGTTLEQLIQTFDGKAMVDTSAYRLFQDHASVIPIVPLETQQQAEASASQHRNLNNIQQQALRMVEQKLILKGYTLNTRKTYLQHFKDFMLFYYDSHPIELTEVDVRNYLLYLIEHKKLSKSTQNQAINAVKFFYEKVLMQERKLYHLERPMRDKKLPEVLSQAEVMAIFEALDNIKHKCILMLTYAAGLRRSELLNLRIGDVDLDRCVVFIRGGKGRKDRQSVMAQSLVPLIEQYLKEYNPQFWLFEGIDGGPYTATSMQNILKKACAKAAIKKNVRLHMLRHSFATHLLESGTSTRYIQVLLGHESPKTTEIYAQVTRFGLDKIVSPLDQMATSRRLRDGDE
jgi:integrase/recombinase XerD